MQPERRVVVDTACCIDDVRDGIYLGLADITILTDALRAGRAIASLDKELLRGARALKILLFS